MNLKKYIIMPRIIGIVLIVIAALASITQGAFRAGLLAIVGLILLFSPTAHTRKQWQRFLASFAFTKEFALIILYDVVFWALLAVLSLVLAVTMRGQITSLQSIQLGQGLAFSQLPAYNGIIEHFFTVAIVGLLLYWLLIVASYSLSRGLIWLTLQKKDIQAGFFARFSLLNLLWCTLWLAAGLFLATKVVQPTSAYAVISLSILYVHLATVLHSQYAKTRAFGKSLKDAFGIGLGEIIHFVHPYCYISVIYVILSQLQRLVQDARGALIVAFIIFLVFMAWYRAYLNAVIRSVA
jgi:hypothetical protein